MQNSIKIKYERNDWIRAEIHSIQLIWGFIIDIN